MSTRFSPIGPVKILRKLHENHALGNYLLFLAHDVIAHEADYVFLLDDAMPQEGSKDFIIMDNGVVELGKAMPFEAVIEAANIVLADCIIMPDVIGDFLATQQAAEAEASPMRNGDYPIMKVPQGGTYKELVQCVEWLITGIPTDGGPDYWGIPRWITNSPKMGTRAPIIDYITRVSPRAKIHLLGMSNNYEDDIRCAQHDHVMGMDSANPIILGIMNHHMGQTAYHHPARGNYWEAEDINHIVLGNLQHVREAISRKI